MSPASGLLHDFWSDSVKYSSLSWIPKQGQRALTSVSQHSVIFRNLKAEFEGRQSGLDLRFTYWGGKFKSFRIHVRFTKVRLSQKEDKGQEAREWQVHRVVVITCLDASKVPLRTQGQFHSVRWQSNSSLPRAERRDCWERNRLFVICDPSAELGPLIPGLSWWEGSRFL